MKKLTTGQKTLIIVGAVLLVAVFWVAGSYNGLVRADETVDEKWANVQTAYQRRIDLIPNLIATVQASADFETNLQTQVTAMRTGLSSAATPEDLEALGTKIETAINLVFEAYPQVRSTENFLSLQDQLEGTENRIKTERDIYNKAVKNMNIKVRRFPTNIIAGIFGFGKKVLFASVAGAETAPDVKALFS